MNKKLMLSVIKFRTKAGQEVEITLDEARDLYKELDDLFGPKHLPQTPIVIDYPWRTGDPIYPYPNPPVVWCESRCESGLSVSLGGSLQD